MSDNINIITKYGQPRIQCPDQQLINLIESMGKAMRDNEHNFTHKRWMRLCEIYYALRYGLYGYAWQKINDLRDDLRWKIPLDVYETLKDICKDMNIKIL
jgi:hypothetical protein